MHRARIDDEMSRFEAEISGGGPGPNDPPPPGSRGSFPQQWAGRGGVAIPPPPPPAAVIFNRNSNLNRAPIISSALTRDNPPAVYASAPKTTGLGTNAISNCSLLPQMIVSLDQVK